MPTGESRHSGPPPKPPNKRRNTTKPANYGLAEPILAGQAARQPDLGFDPHPMVARMWAALASSVESRFYSAADWERASFELFFANEVLEGRIPMSSSNWQRIQQGLNELLVSPADKRRAGIELKAAADPDEEAAVLQMVQYRDKLSQ
jgi:hypothetical protein